MTELTKVTFRGVARYDQFGIARHESADLNLEGRLAAGLIEKWGAVAATNDGEDSAGRAKVRLVTPDELVDRAISVALAFGEKARAAGLIVQTPSYDELSAQADEDRKRN